MVYDVIILKNNSLRYYRITICSNKPMYLWVHICAPIRYPTPMAKKDVAFKIRVEEELRREFVEICQADDMTAAQVVRRFMRRYIENNKKTLQGSLFSDEEYSEGGAR